MGDLAALRARLSALLPDAGAALHVDPTTGARHLDLSRFRLSIGQASRLAALSGLEPLSSLVLDDSPIAVAGGLAVVGERQLQGLHTLSMCRCGLSDAVVQVLAANYGHSSLRVLRLAGNGLSDAAVHALTASPRLHPLTPLALSDNPITDLGARHLAAAPGVRQLRSLDLSGCRITEHGRKLLFYSHSLHFSIRSRLDPGRNASKTLRNDG